MYNTSLKMLILLQLSAIHSDSAYIMQPIPDWVKIEPHDDYKAGYNRYDTYDHRHYYNYDNDYINYDNYNHAYNHGDHDNYDNGYENTNSYHDAIMDADKTLGILS